MEERRDNLTKEVNLTASQRGKQTFATAKTQRTKQFIEAIV